MDNSNNRCNFMERIWSKIRIVFTNILTRIRKGPNCYLITVAEGTTSNNEIIGLSDHPQKGQWGFQDPASDWMYAIIDLHDRIIFYLIIILSVVLWIQISAIINKDHIAYLDHNNMIELIWTQTPAGILWAIGLPSQRQLYIMDEIQDAEITIKAIGNQWYWSYEYSDYINQNKNDVIFDSFMVDQSNLATGDIRNLTVDNSQVIPVGVSIRLIVTSNDVIHCFAIPSLALKSDAIPGRINAAGFIINRPSHYYGQCSELCGILHGFMPISIKAVSLNNYIHYLREV